jgi:pyrroline-5-carboxylate reductase
MPNTPALVRAGATALCGGRATRPVHLALARSLFSCVGITAVLAEESMNGITALSGSGPAYLFLVCEILARAGAAAGVPVDTATAFARQTVHGAGALLSARSEPADTLRAQVTSPGGTTAAALQVLMERGIERIFTEAVAAAVRRAEELSA